VRSNIWPYSMTRHARYCEPGLGNDPIVGKYALLYSLFSPKKRLRILDVGCSTGLPARHLKGYLKEFGVGCTVDGMDASEEVAADATSNLDRFYLGNLFDVDVEPAYDIVICSRLLRFLDPPERCEGVSRCASFCNDGGMVITDGIPDSRYAVNEYVMLPRAALLDEAACCMRDLGGRPKPRERPTRRRTFLDIYCCRLASWLIRRYIDNEGKKKPGCPYCRGP